MLNKKIVFIGPGVMAEAMIAGLLRQKLADPKNIIASGPREERGGELHMKYGIKVTTDNASAVHEADVIVLSVKPQRLSEVMKGIKGIRPNALVISIIAGASIKKISTGIEAQGHCAFDAKHSGSDRRRDHGLGGFKRCE